MVDTRTANPDCRTRIWTDERTVTVAIVCAVADAEGISPEHVDPPLGDVIDTDLLDRLFVSADGESRVRAGRVIFPYRGHEVTVHADGYVTIDQEANGDLD